MEDSGRGTWIERPPTAILDRQAKAQELSAEHVKKRREEHTPAILAGIRAWLDMPRSQVLPQSPMAEAIEYTTERRAALGRFVEDGRLELDNNTRGPHTALAGRSPQQVLDVVTSCSLSVTASMPIDRQLPLEFNHKPELEERT